MAGEDAQGIGAWYREHRTLLDPLALAVFCVLAAALGFNGIWNLFALLPEGQSAWWTLATALPGCLLLLGKNRHPQTMLVLAAVLFVADMLTVGGLGPLIVLLDVLWTAVFRASARGRSRLLAALALATVVMFASAVAFTPATPANAFLIALQFGAFVGTDYWWAVAVSQANELAELHRRSAEETVLAAARDRAEAIRREREQTARELHDAVAGHVMAMAIRSEAALSTPPDEAADRSALRAVRDAGLDAHAALRSMIAVLRRGDGDLQPAPRLSDLAGIVADARRAGLRVDLSRHDVAELPPLVEQALVRIIREALANCVRHAGGADVDVEIVAHGEDVRVQVLSRGGVPAAAPAYSGSGWGLAMLTERVRGLGGTFHAGPVEDGWSVRAELPTGAAA